MKGSFNGNIQGMVSEKWCSKRGGPFSSGWHFFSGSTLLSIFFFLQMTFSGIFQVVHGYKTLCSESCIPEPIQHVIQALSSVRETQCRMSAQDVASRLQEILGGAGGIK